jgi:hypothetical protein
MKQLHLKARISRRIPDPVFTGCNRHIFLCSVEDVPEGIPTDPNPREQNIDRGIYRDIKKHLLNQMGEANTFHLKNKGITILADEVQQQGHGEDFVVTFSEGQGIVDGGHTYNLIVTNQREVADINKVDNNSIQQFVKIEVLTGYSSAIVLEVAGGLNTAVQVQQMSLTNLGGNFQWIKEELEHEPYFDHIAFKEGERRQFDVRDILVLLDLFNVAEYPTNFAAGPKYPIRAYSSKEAVLKSFKARPQNYEQIRPILKDILTLHDTISFEAAEQYSESGGRAGKLKFVEYSPDTKKPFDFPFIQENGQYRLFRSALFPMLGAFRYMVELDPATDQVHWKGGFDKVLELWEASGLSLMEATKRTCQELGYNLNAIGKSQNHWQSLYFEVLQKAMQAGF